jgi:UDP-N-acetyl-D-glucosamine dehydrogenase
MARLSECDVVSICVPTPLSKTRDPDVSYILAASQSVAAACGPGSSSSSSRRRIPARRGRSCSPPSRRGGSAWGRTSISASRPERVDPGNETWTTKNTPKVVGGITAGCTQAGARFYERFLDTIVPVSSAEAAELTKILENTFRAVNIGLVNETALIAERLGVDVWEVIDAASTKPFGFMKFTPGPGLGGHCIPVDPHYLSWKMRTLNYKTRFIELASEINAEMPIFVADKVRDALNHNRKSVNGSHVLVLGVAYKRDIDDVRESPALDVIRLLEADGAHVNYHDPYVPEVRDDGKSLCSVELTDAALAEADAVVILTDHSAFDYDRIVEHANVLIDARHAVPRAGRAIGTGWVVKS